MQGGPPGGGTARPSLPPGDGARFHRAPLSFIRSAPRRGVDPAGWVLVAVGLAAGAVSSMFGVGGGLVVVPVLHYLFKVDFRVATVTSLVAIAVQSPFGVLQHARRGVVSWRLGAWLAGGGAFGVAAGVWLQPRIPVSGLKVLLAGLMAFGAWRMVASPPRPRGAGLATPWVGATGVVAGAASRLLGIGGGLIAVPVLALGGTPMHQAVGSSLVAVFTNSLLAAAIAAAAGFDPGSALWLAAGAILGSPLGVRLAHAIPELGLRRAFAGGLGVAALYVAATSGAL